jgi:predicted RNase H-like HicB family nuclease
MNFTIEAELEEDGRWLAEVPQLPGVLAYGVTRDEAMSRAQVLALRVIAERLEHGEASPQSINISVPASGISAPISSGFMGIMACPHRG